VNSHNNQKMTREREEDSKVGSGDNRGDTEMRDVETAPEQKRGRTRESNTEQTEASNIPTDETTEKCERAEWRRRSCKSLL
jgi:hypothetical protein